MDPEGNLLIADGFTALYDKHARTLCRYCARRVGPDLAEDAVAQTFLIAYERRHVIEGGTADPLPWLFGIATNVLFRHRRDEVRGYRALARTGADPLLVPTATESHAARADERADARQRARLIARVLGGLARGRFRLAGAEQPTPRHRRQWVLASVGAAAAVAVVIGAVAALDGGPAARPADEVGAPKPAASGRTAQADKLLPVEQGTRAPVNPQVTGNGGATHEKAVAALDRLATAAPMPVPLGDGKVLYVKTYNLQEGDARYIHELWVDPANVGVLRIRRTDSSTSGSSQGRRSPPHSTQAHPSRARPNQVPPNQVPPNQVPPNRVCRSRACRSRCCPCPAGRRRPASRKPGPPLAAAHTGIGLRVGAAHTE